MAITWRFAGPMSVALLLWVAVGCESNPPPTPQPPYRSFAEQWEPGLRLTYGDELRAHIVNWRDRELAAQIGESGPTGQPVWPVYLVIYRVPRGWVPKTYLQTVGGGSDPSPHYFITDFDPDTPGAPSLRYHTARAEGGERFTLAGKEYSPANGRVLLIDPQGPTVQQIAADLDGLFEAPLPGLARLSAVENLRRSDPRVQRFCRPDPDADD